MHIRLYGIAKRPTTSHCWKETVGEIVLAEGVTLNVLALDQLEDGCEEMRRKMHWKDARHADLCLSNVRFSDTDVGKQFAIGDGQAIIEVVREAIMSDSDKIRPYIHTALQQSWRAGAICKVVQGGTVRVDDIVVRSARMPQAA